MTQNAAKPLISLIIPCYNEEEVIRTCHERVIGVINHQPYNFEIIYIDDGSCDQTWELLKDIQAQDPRVTVISLSRNFGKESAMTAGLRESDGDAVVIIDADLQDPPELIPDLINIWLTENADVVYAKRKTREGETWLKKLTASGFYQVINFVSDVAIPVNTGDFRLMNRRAVEALARLNERHRFMKGLFAWIGYKQIAFEYDRAPRAAGTTKWNYYKLFNFALEGITGFSMTPLRVASICGFIISALAFIFGAWIILKTLIFGSDLPGYPSLMVMISFFSGIQLLSIGILGEYIGRIFGETKNRPLYFIQERLSSKN